jgi:tetratricopeptide (TPR) repeat protein
MDSGIKVELGFVQRRLPWLVAAVALVVYAVTLNHSATFAGVSALAKAAGWDWRSNVVAPLHVLLTFPVRWLPAGVQLIGLNLIAAACASLALALLARSVALLPHDRTREQRAVERSDYSLLSISTAWLPPVLAALVCGFQLTFWENAVVASGEAFDVLLFAWLIHCLLQYRLDDKESRLTVFALVYGLAVVNNHAMIGFFPAFLIALVWIKRMAFFKWRFLLRMAGWGAAGLLLYLVLPVMESAGKNSSFSFWELLRTYWGIQRKSLVEFPRYVILFISFTSVLPVLFMGIRWPAQFGEVSAVGNALTNLMTHVIHGIFLVAALYVAFDPPFSPRSLSYGISPLLPFYYLGALAAGYCCGYFLLVFGPRPAAQSWQRPSMVRSAIHYAVLALVWAAAVAAPVGLFIRNLPVIRASGGDAMSRLSRAAAQSLPEQGAVVLSDDLFRLYALQYELLKTNPGHKHILVDTASLMAPAYHLSLQTRHPERWPRFGSPPNLKIMLPPESLIGVLYQLAGRERVYYLHPSFGYYFEHFFARPHRMVYELRLCPTNSLAPPPLTPAEIKEQDDFWRGLKSREIDPLIAKAVPFVKPRPGKDKPKPVTLDTYLAHVYSRALNDFGAEVQRAGALPLAGEYFDWAAQVNPANPAAFLNREFNRQWSETKKSSEKLNEGTLDRLAAYGGRWDGILGQNGPVDEPNACYLLAQSFEQGGNYRQAGQNLERTLFFEPDNRSAQIISIFLHIKAQMPDLALQRAGAFRTRFGGAGLKEEEESELIRAEAWAYVMKGDLATAEGLLASAQRRFPRQSTPWETLFDIYSQLGQITNAIATLDRQLKAQPDSVPALINYGVLNIRLSRFTEALQYLERALQLKPGDEAALLNRAIAHFSLDKLDAAVRDLDTLRNSGTPAYQVRVVFHLGECYFRKKNRREALRYYKEFLKIAPPGTPEIAVVNARIKLLEGGGAF